MESCIDTTYDAYILKIKQIESRKLKLEQCLVDEEIQQKKLKQLLNCDDEADMEQLQLALGISPEQFTTNEYTKVTSYVSIHHGKFALRLLGSEVRFGPNKEIVIEMFCPSSFHTQPQRALLIFYTANERFDAALPYGLSINELLEDMNMDVDDVMNEIPTFVHKIELYLHAYWKREHEYRILKESNILPNSLNFHRKAYRIITFSFSFEKHFTVEFLMRYNLKDSIPYSVKFSELDNKELDKNIYDMMTAMKLDLLKYPLAKYLLENLEESSSIMSSTESQSSVLTVGLYA